MEYISYLEESVDIISYIDLELKNKILIYFYEHKNICFPIMREMLNNGH